MGTFRVNVGHTLILIYNCKLRASIDLARFLVRLADKKSYGYLPKVRPVASFKITGFAKWAAPKRYPFVPISEAAELLL